MFLFRKKAIPAAQADAKPPTLGDRMPDGTVYAGFSPTTGKAMYTTPADAPLPMTFKDAKQYATKLKACSHDDWRVPTRNELNALFNNRASIGALDGASSPAHCYWSASERNDRNAWFQRFTDGFQHHAIKTVPSSVRCVR